MADRLVLIVIIAALVAERLWSVPEPQAAPPVEEQSSANPDHAYMPARLYVRRCAAEGKEFVIHGADGKPMKAFCVRTPEPVFTSAR